MPSSASWYPGFRFSKLPPFSWLPDAFNQTVIDPINQLSHVKAVCAYSPLPCTRSGGRYTYGEEYGPPTLPRPRTSRSADNESQTAGLNGGSIGPSEAVAFSLPRTRTGRAMPVLTPEEYGDFGERFEHVYVWRRPDRFVNAELEAAAALRDPNPLVALAPEETSGDLCGAFHGVVSSYNETEVKFYIGATVSLSGLPGIGPEVSVTAEAWVECNWKTKPVKVSYGENAARCMPNACENETAITVTVEYALTGNLVLKLNQAISAGPYSGRAGAQLNLSVRLVDSWDCLIKADNSEALKHLHMPEVPALPPAPGSGGSGGTTGTGTTGTGTTGSGTTDPQNP